MRRSRLSYAATLAASLAVLAPAGMAHAADTGLDVTASHDSGRTGLDVAATVGFLDGAAAPGVSAYWHLSRRDEIGVSLRRDSQPEKVDPGTEGFKASGTADETLVLLGARHFFGESFYLSYGLGFRQVSEQASAADSFLSVETTTSSSAAIAAVGLGNQWHWSNGIFAGIDWIDLMAPFGSWSRSRTAIHTPFPIDDTGADDDSAHYAERQSRHASLALGTLSLGYAF